MYKKIKFDYAHSALEYLIKKYQIEKLHIPYYLCDVIRHSVVKAGCKPIFYHIDDEFYPAEPFDKESFILYPNYFGICDENVNKIVKKYPNIIVDNAHSFYSPPQGFACFNSERKFKKVPNGAYLYIKENNIEGNYDIEPCPKSRIEEFILLSETYGNKNFLKFDIPRSPFCYPYLAATDEEADKLAEELENKGKVIYRYWNNLPKDYNEYKFYRRLVPIPLELQSPNR